VADILLSNEDLTVFGGPESISLDLDIGPQGDRGSIIVGSNGNPQDANVHQEILNIPEGIQALDIAIDYNPYSPTYKTVFQRIATTSGTQWTEMVSLKTNFYSSIKEVTGSNGKLVIPPINVTDIYDGFESGSEVTSSNFNVQYSVSSPDSGGPLATTLVVKDLVTSQGFLALPLEIKGVEYVDGVWGPIAGPKNVHLFITVV
jgi:hypothetical protein